MIDQILSPLVVWIVGVISSAGYLGVVLLMAIESACIPLPSERFGATPTARSLPVI
jgi:membrane protein DedA with SNARE-associated domain